MIQYTGGPSQPGDSGGSMYLPGATGQVFARGSVIAGNGTTSFAEPWSRMSSCHGRVDRPEVGARGGGPVGTGGRLLPAVGATRCA